MSHRLLIVARMDLADARHVADLFAASDGTDLPHDLGVLRRDLYTYQGLYFHHVELAGRPDAAMAQARDRDDFRRLSADLDPYVRPYDPQTWRSPADAAATPFYRWEPGAAWGTGAAASRVTAPAVAAR